MGARSILDGVERLRQFEVKSLERLRKVVKGTDIRGAVQIREIDRINRVEGSSGRRFLATQTERNRVSGGLLDRS
jgi:hypothetical protein